jgi:hypothetical protein
MTSPSESFLKDTQSTRSILDTIGRRIEVRRLTALDRLRLFKALGPSLTQNALYLGMATLAYAVTTIDSVPVPPPINEGQLEALVGRLGDSGLTAIAAAIAQDDAAPSGAATVGN